MKYKLIASDFDGTLLNSKKELTNYTKETLQKLKQDNYIIVGVTGRNLSSSLSVVNTNLFNYLILNNGSHIYDTLNQKDIYMNILDIEVIKNIANDVESDCKKIEFLSKNYYYRYIAPNIENSKIIKPITSLNEIEEPILNIEIFFKDDNLLNDCREYLLKTYKNINAYIMQDSFATKKWIIVSDKNISKEITLKNLAKKLNIEIPEILFFGDGLNDLEVFKSDITTVATSNALDEIKEYAHYITKTNNEDGVAVFLENLIKNK